MSKWTTKAQMRELLPAEVLQRVDEMMKRHRTRKVRVYPKDFSAGGPLLAEGHRYQFYRNGDWRVLTMQSQRTLHAGGHQLSHAICERVPAEYLQPGTWIIESQLSLGHYFIDVINVVDGPPMPEPQGIPLLHSPKGWAVSPRR